MSNVKVSVVTPEDVVVKLAGIVKRKCQTKMN
jgi:hypothetical protein